MKRTLHRSPLAKLATGLALVVLLVAAVPGQAAKDFDPDAFLRNGALKKDLQKLDSDAAAQDAIMTHANSAFGISKTIFDFAAELAGGDYTEQIEAILDVPVQQWNANRGVYGSYEIVNVKRIVRRNQTSSLFGGMKDNMNNLALGLSVYSIMKDVAAGLGGDNNAKLKAIKGTYDVVSGYWASRVGWNSLGTAMIGVGVISYALDTFIATTFSDYSDQWWNQYSGYLNEKYPNLVTGPDSWAALARDGGEQAVMARLDEFWGDPYSRVTGTSFIKETYADMQLSKAYAARYYQDYLHTTLKTHFRLEAEKAEALAWYKADKAYRDLLRQIADLEQLRQAIADAGEFGDEEEDEEEEEPPVGLLLRPASKTIEVGESVSYTPWFLFADHTLEPAIGAVSWGGSASGPTFTGAEPGEYTITALCNGLTATATVTVRETVGDDDEEDEIDEAIEQIEDPEDDVCEAAGIAEMRSTLAGLIGRVQSKGSVVDMYKTKFDKELADRAADPCGNSLMAYCYQQAQQEAGDLEFLVDEIRELAGSLLMQMALCPDEVDASGAPISIADVIKDIAKAGSARGDAQSALAAMQSRLGENGCDEDEFEELADRFTEDGQDPDGLQDGGNMSEIAGDGVDNDQDGQQEEDWSEVAGKTVTIVVYDSGNFKDDVFGLSVSGVGSLGLTPAGGLRTYGLDLAPGSYTASVSVVVAPDNCGTVTAIAMQNGVQIGALGSGESCPPVGAVLSFTFTVSPPE